MGCSLVPWTGRCLAIGVDVAVGRGGQLVESEVASEAARDVELIELLSWSTLTVSHRSCDTTA